MRSFEKFRALFPVTKTWNYLVTGATAPLSIPVYEACQNYLRENNLEGFKHYSEIANIIEEPKALFAKLINCRPQELAMIPNSTHGINVVAKMLRPRKGENVVISDLEYYGCAFPWLQARRYGAEVRIAKSRNGRLSVEQIAELVDDRTKILSIAHVCHSGLRQDIAELSRIAHSHGAYFVSDAIGSCGVVEVDVRASEVDFTTTSSYKWLLGLQGSGFLYVRRKLIDAFDPPIPGSQATREFDPYRFMISPDWKMIPFSRTASRYETGMPAIISALSLAASIKLILQVGISAIERRVSEITQYAVDRMNAIGLEVVTPAEKRSRGAHIIVAMSNKKYAKDVCARLFRKKIHVQSYTPTYCSKYGALFVAPDFFNTEEEIEQLATSLKRMIND